MLKMFKEPERHWKNIKGLFSGPCRVYRLGCPKKGNFLVLRSTTSQGLCMYALSHQKKFQNIWSKTEWLRPILSFGKLPQIPL